MKQQIAKTPATTSRRKASGRHTPAPGRAVPDSLRSELRGILTGHAVQPKLTVSRPDDRYEREADALATRHRVNNTPEQRLVQPAGANQPLSASVRAHFEERFGRPLHGIKIHADSHAERFARNLGARAFAHGSDIWFGGGQLDTGSSAGRGLIAHELAHTALRHRGLNLQVESAEIPSAVALAAAGPTLALAPAQLATVEVFGGAMSGVWEGLQASLVEGDRELFVDMIQGLPENAATFMMGAQIGYVIGLGEGVYNNLASFYELGELAWDFYKSRPWEQQVELAASLLSPFPGATLTTLASIAARELWENRDEAAKLAEDIIDGVRKVAQELEADDDWLAELGRTAGEPLGKLLGKWFRTELLYAPDYNYRGMVLGRVAGMVALEILFLVLAPEAFVGKVGLQTGARAGRAVRTLAQGLRDTKLWRRIEEVVAKSPELRRSMSLSKTGPAAKKAFLTPRKMRPSGEPPPRGQALAQKRKEAEALAEVARRQKKESIIADDAPLTSGHRAHTTRLPQTPHQIPHLSHPLSKNIVDGQKLVIRKHLSAWRKQKAVRRAAGKKIDAAGLEKHEKMREDVETLKKALTGYGNSAAFKVKVDGVDDLIVMHNIPRHPDYPSLGFPQTAGAHAEEMIIFHLQQLRKGGKKVEVLKIYSEIKPCRGRCSPEIRKLAPDAPIFYSFDTGEQLKAARLELFRTIFKEYY